MATPGWRDWNETATGASGVTVTHAASSGVLHKVTHISGYTDTDADITIHDGDGSAEIIWEVKIDVSLNGNAFAINIPNGVYKTPGNAISGKISAGGDDRINISGESLP